MRLALHTVICCCVFTTVLPLVKGATGEFNTSLKKRFRVWLQSRMRRDLHSSLETTNDKNSDINRLLQDGNAETAPLPSSFGLNIRPRRAQTTKSSGCLLFTCSYHDLIHRLHQINQDKLTTAPQRQISPHGYGRRRRSLQDVTQLAFVKEGRRRSTEAASKVNLAAQTEDNS